jgi:hypothetical protein
VRNFVKQNVYIDTFRGKIGECIAYEDLNTFLGLNIISPSFEIMATNEDNGIDLVDQIAHKNYDVKTTKIENTSGTYNKLYVITYDTYTQKSIKNIDYHILVRLDYITYQYDIGILDNFYFKNIVNFITPINHHFIFMLIIG